MLNQYLSCIEELLQQVKNDESTLKKAAKYIADSIKNNGLIHIFGCGHSHLIGEEIFYRAGGLVPVHPILIEDLMLHKGAARSSQLERQNDFIQPYLEKYDINKNDVFIVVSTSGINGVPIDAALYAKNKGARVIALTSAAYSKQSESRHHSKKKLYEIADLVIDNHSAPGDAIIKDERIGQAFGPTSTVIGTTIINCIIVEAIDYLADENLKPPIFMSGNIKGADAHNQHLITKYKDRIPNLS
ncbi:putative phosphosugar-binding protein [Scopulibacillus daqui]|uniref:UPF0309 protein JOD45_002779 n=1 Tax=Scopulibacillus daqui TaxID=1469162 RepID=A0ABS2Q4D3_9BACL|nr:SIS domain-containing protein [Scopulibacillus daqui]MBM7646549.1 putative phosphosugar-binding protein [Scopulibacillus daqui]